MTRRALALALILVAAPPAVAQSPRAGCVLVDGRLPDGCAHPNAGLVVSTAPALTAHHEPAGDLGDLGFSISIEPTAAAPGPRRHVAGTRIDRDALRALDTDLARLGLTVSVDRLGARPILNVQTVDLRQGFRAGETVTFRTSSNYPAWIDRAEIRILDADAPGTPLAILPTGANAETGWPMPAEGPERMLYVLRVYDAAGRWDETHPLPLDRRARTQAPDLTAPVAAAGEAEDRTARRRIPVHGAVVTVAGQDLPSDARLTVMGEPVVPDLRRRFVLQRILPPGTHDLTIATATDRQQRRVTIPRTDLFATGLIDLTLGYDHAAGEAWRYGRIAGFVDGILADGTRLTAMIDTRDRELRDLLRNPLRRNPDQVLRQIEDRDVWLTTGDDSRIERLAPTSGGLYLRLERDGNWLMWGDVRPEGALGRLARTDRTLYGLAGSWRSQATTSEGEARAAVQAFAATADRLTQRDIFRGTGGSTYVLSFRDIEAGTETVIVEVRDPVTGRQLSARRLRPGTDYRLNALQGIVILSQPLPPVASGGGLVPGGADGEAHVNLVVQYDYVPSSGAGGRGTAGARIEGWLTDDLRLGATGIVEQTGPADHTLAGVDLLWQRSPETWLSVEIARSEGPGFGTRTSLTGGLDLDPPDIPPGARGNPATGLRIEGRLDLAELGGQGFLAGHYHRFGAGFSSPDVTAADDRTSAGVEGRIGLGPRATLAFAADRTTDGRGRDDRRARLGIETALRPDLTLALEWAHRDRTDPMALRPDAVGRRDTLGARLTWRRDDDLSLWAFGRTTLRAERGLSRDDRFGVGAEAALTDRLRLLAEVSYGTLGLAGRAELGWQPDARSRLTLGWREDPADGLLSATGTTRALTFGARREINDAWALTTETTRSLRASQPSLATTWGLSYTPDQRWTHEATLLHGTTREAGGTDVRRRAVSLGTRFSAGEDGGARLRAEWRTDTSDRPASGIDRTTWALSAGFSHRTSEDWRLEGALDALISRGRAAPLRDGRYVEARLGYAYRPVASDRLNALLSYTWLEDLPGPDQANIDGDRAGPLQRSHILNAALSYELSPRFTLGLKYGFRFRQQADRGSTTFTASTGHLFVARLDYRIVHAWDAMAELRAFHAPRAGHTDYGAVLGIYREVNRHARIGVGYAWGGVQDDLRRIRPARAGLFLNVIGRF